jgi:hypothetical protein
LHSQQHFETDHAILNGNGHHARGQSEQEERDGHQQREHGALRMRIHQSVDLPPKIHQKNRQHKKMKLGHELRVVLEILRFSHGWTSDELDGTPRAHHIKIEWFGHGD